MESLIKEIRAQLKENVDERARQSGQRFFREPVRMYGMKTSVALRIAKQALARLKGRPQKEVFALCEQLWRSGYMEESFIACKWAESLHKQYQPEDFTVFEGWLEKYVSNWASCDTL